MWGIMFILIICFFYILLSKKRKNKKIFVIILLLIFIIANDDKNIQINIVAKQYSACAYETKLQQYGEYARNSMRQTGVYASLTLAQGIIEQQLGTSNSNNMFGIKATGVATVPLDDPNFTSLNQSQQAKCESINGSWVKTSEWTKSKGTYKAMACFKTYDTAEGSFIDHGEWLLTSFANRNTFAGATTLEDQLSALVNNPVAMYATGQNYLCNLITQINACDLTRFDDGVSFNDRGVSIVGKHTSNIKIDNCGSYKSEGSINNSNTLEHFGTNYSGDLTKGWIYNRFNFKEKVDLNIPDYMIEKNINDIIDEMFDRAKTSYVSIYGYEGGGSSSYGYSAKSCDELSGKSNFGDPSSWKQGYDLWGNIAMGSTNISDAGCLVTSYAIQLKNMGITAGIDNFNPGTFACYLSKNGQFDSGGFLSEDWFGKLGVYKDTTLRLITGSKQNQIEQVKERINSGCHLIMSVQGPTVRSTHFVAVVGTTNDNILINDPGSSATTLWPTYNVTDSGIKCLKAS